MGINDPTPAVSGNGAAIAPRLASSGKLVSDDLPVLHVATPSQAKSSARCFCTSAICRVRSAAASSKRLRNCADDFSTRTYTARAYLAGQPANPFSHSIHEDKNYDFRQLHERTLIEGIMKEARRDVVERIWEGSILKARRELKVPGL
jgi:hypothetical protein